MRSIKANFKKSAKKNPELGDYIHLANAVKGQKYSKRSIGQAFNELMSKQEYQMNENKQLIKHLVYLTNLSEEGMLKPKNRL